MGQQERNSCVDYLSKLGRLVLGIAGGLVSFYLRENVALAVSIFAVTCVVIAVVTWWQPILRFLLRLVRPPRERNVIFRTQKVELDVGSGGNLNRITTTTEVQNVGNKAVPGYPHSFFSVTANISGAAIQAFDNDGQLRVAQSISSPGLQSFEVIFPQPLQSHQRYIYSWAVSNIPNFFKNWWWQYSPIQRVDAFALTVLHPPDLQVTSHRMEDMLDKTIVGKLQRDYYENRAKTTVTLTNVTPGSYRYEWAY